MPGSKKGAARKNPGAKRKLETRTRDQRAYQMRLQGLSYVEIADKLGVTAAATHGMVMRVIAEQNDQRREDVPKLRAMELDRLDKYLAALWLRAKKGDVYAIQTALKVSERRSKIAGLDVPAETKVTGSGENGAIAIELFRKMLDGAALDPDNANLTLKDVVA